jgi:hypothetical protein
MSTGNIMQKEIIDTLFSGFYNQLDRKRECWQETIELHESHHMICVPYRSTLADYLLPWALENTAGDVFFKLKPYQYTIYHSVELLTYFTDEEDAVLFKLTFGDK